MVVGLTTTAPRPQTFAAGTVGGDPYYINGNVRCSIGFSVVGGFVSAGQGVGHLLVKDPAAARRALSGLCEIRDEREVLVVELEDRPGALGYVARRMAEAGVNVELGYLTAATQIVLAVSDIEKARAAL